MESAEHAAAILTQLFILLVAAKIGDEAFKRIHQPAVIGEILGGVLVGPAVLNLYHVTSETALFAEIAVVLLLFQVGLGTRLGDLLSVGRSALTVATLGVVFPLAGGFLLAELFGAPLQVASLGNEPERPKDRHAGRRSGSRPSIRASSRARSPRPRGPFRRMSP